MPSCFTCGKTFSKDTTELIRRYKKEFRDFGIERYVYRLSPTSPVMIIRKEYFNGVFEQHIKPKLSQGAQYMHIDEYTGA